MTLSFLKVGAALALALTLGACTKTYVTTRALSYNKALSQYMNQEILLNAVRASKRRAMSFSTIGDYQGTKKSSATMSASLPFMMGVLENYTLSPSVTGNLQDLTNYGNLNTKEFYSDIQDEVSGELLKYYYDNGWPRSLLYMIFIREFSVSRGQYEHMLDVASRGCQKNGYKGRCRVLKDIVSRLEEMSALSERGNRCWRELKDIKGNSALPVISFRNHARNECSYRKFEYFVQLIEYLKFKPSVGERKHSERPTKKTETKKRGSTVIVTTESDLSSSVPIDFTSNLASLRRLKLSGGKGSVHLRSPEQMIYYMGSLIAAQNYLPEGERYMPTIRVGSKYTPAPLFEVRRGPVAKSVISVRDELDGDVFSIPRPNYGASDEARSLTLITMVNQIIALLTVRDDIPTSSSITLTTN